MLARLYENKAHIDCQHAIQSLEQSVLSFPICLEKNSLLGSFFGDAVLLVVRTANDKALMTFFPLMTMELGTLSSFEPRNYGMVKWIYPLNFDAGVGSAVVVCFGRHQVELQRFGMDFVYNGRRMVLRGTQKAALQWMNGKRQSKATSNGQVFCVYPNTLFSMTQTTTSPPCSQITDLLDSYQDVFVTPTSLPPKRKQDHRIPLVPNTPPINIRPYKHPPNQKDVVEAMVQELMESGAIRDSQSPYSSPIVMVKKKDGTWRMCVDYRQLNKYTVKDKFPIPVVEELLDELSGAQFFSKLDLRSVYFPRALATFTIGVASYETELLVCKDEQVLFIEDSLRIMQLISPNLYLIIERTLLLTFTVETDASGMGIGAVLQQGGHPIAYLSKSLSPKHQALSTYEKEFYAVLMALEKWRGYLLDRHFKIKTDHFSLKYLLDQRVTIPLMMYYVYLTMEKWRRKGKLVVGSNEQLRQALVTYFHSDPVGGHSGVQVTVKKLGTVLYGGE
ncbi:reverse transcriptase [Tanacetum coccineum]